MLRHRLSAQLTLDSPAARPSRTSSPRKHSSATRSPRRRACSAPPSALPARISAAFSSLRFPPAPAWKGCARGCGGAGSGRSRRSAPRSVPTRRGSRWRLRPPARSRSGSVECSTRSGCATEARAPRAPVSTGLGLGRGARVPDASRGRRAGFGVDASESGVLRAERYRGLKRRNDLGGKPVRNRTTQGRL